ncbi:hypothetical protein XELAEV_18047402mg [Xenopus laevis]|uniref:Reverse transcriptase domain-containing protein n=1 Tax=Xenopus laevis TaxID=8355 RepID=A0A974BUR3_XENLA|nr:hypothetical protein XELAEV_18047402mg [Xenopus laevis]
MEEAHRQLNVIELYGKIEHDPVFEIKREIDRLTHESMLEGGTSVGAAVASSLADIIVHDLEQKLFIKGPHNSHIIKYLRFVDDILVIWKRTEEEFHQMIEEAKQEHPTITSEISASSINYLDVNISIHGQKIVTTVFSKPTDLNTLLVYDSFHNSHIIKAIPKWQYIRSHKKILTRGHKREKLASLMEEVSQLDRGGLLQTKQKVKGDMDRVPFVTKFGKQSKSIESIIKQYWPILEQDNQYGCLYKQPLLFCYNKRSMGTARKGTFPCLSCICCSSIMKVNSQPPHKRMIQAKRGGDIKKSLGQREAYSIKIMNMLPLLGMNDYWSLFLFL